MEDEAQAKALAAEMTGDGKLKRKRGSRKKGGVADRDKVDGRAAPRQKSAYLPFHLTTFLRWGGCGGGEEE